MNLSVLVLENAIIGGQIANATGIENYPGLPNVSGRALIEATQQQAEGFGAVIDEFDAIQKVNLKEDPKLVETEACIYEAETVIIASGMERRKLPLSEEKKYAGKGVHYCELCDGHMYQDKVIAVMGGGNAAVDAANFLTKYAKKLYLVHRSQLRADEASQTKLRENPKVEIFLETEIKALKGESRLEAIDIFDKASGESRELAVDGIFVNIGVSPHTDLFKDEVRALGEVLGLDHELVWRQPFPGPGLAIRVLGEVTAEKLAILREADFVFRDEIAKAGLDSEIWQYFAVLPGTRSVGVMGDERTYDYTIGLRAVTSVDGMTADWARIPHEVLERISTRMVNEVAHVNRVVYDITAKPPSTIEWE